jgi:hypothetical protein
MRRLHFRHPRIHARARKGPRMTPDGTALDRRTPGSSLPMFLGFLAPVILPAGSRDWFQPHLSGGLATSERTALQEDFPEVNIGTTGDGTWWVAAHRGKIEPPFLRRRSAAELRTALDAWKRGEQPPADLLNDTPARHARSFRDLGIGPGMKRVRVRSIEPEENSGQGS